MQANGQCRQTSLSLGSVGEAMCGIPGHTSPTDPKIIKETASVCKSDSPLALHCNLQFVKHPVTRNEGMRPSCSLSAKDKYRSCVLVCDHIYGKTTKSYQPSCIRTDATTISTLASKLFELGSSNKKRAGAQGTNRCVQGE